MRIKELDFHVRMGTTFIPSNLLPLIWTVSKEDSMRTPMCLLSACAPRHETLFTISSPSMQVVFLTHHDHLVPLAKEVLGADLNVVQL